MNELLSNCCCAPPLGEIGDDNFGFCADCKEQAEFEDHNEEESE